MLSLVWLRRDLRLHDHAALATALAEPAPVQMVFVFDTAILARFTNPDDRRLRFIAAALCRIDATLKTRGGGLLVLHGDAETIIPKLAATLGAGMVVSAEDFEPATRARDAAVKQAFGGRFVQVVDHVLRAPYQILKDDQSPFKVFTPFYKRWVASLTEINAVGFEIKDKDRYAAIELNRRVAQDAGLKLVPTESPTAMLDAIGYRYAEDARWPVEEGGKWLATFSQRAMAEYPVARDVMAKHGTSRLGPYLRHGLISIRECYSAAREATGSATWLKELCWREFYMMIMFHWPEVVTQEFMPQYRGTIPWDRSAKVKEALYGAKTGYPIVDAALRELFTTGWMHNRARMIVASFFTKDLLMDWRIGEECFAQHLMDYELASNNGGWQWCASTGTDAQPYFRVFNPLLQSKKFDPNGEYIRRYLPNFVAVPEKEVHWPHGTLYCPRDYPAPIVDHATAKQRAVDAFKKAKP